MLLLQRHLLLPGGLPQTVDRHLWERVEPVVLESLHHQWLSNNVL
jgi:hypothetical protein